MNAITQANLIEFEKDFPEANSLETIEQQFFVNWLDLAKLQFTSIPNSTWTSSHKQKKKNKLEGLRPGFPDMVVIINKEQSTEERDLLLCIEMKQQKKGVVSEYQEKWINALNGIEDVEARVCHGAKEAIDFVKEYLKFN